ncbi:MAG: SxtJ family membrane protein [Myxococcales bacterium]|nr:SxtJ family membrane protein [Myxococcales bacterium]
MASLVTLDLHPDEGTLRRFGFIALFGFGMLAAFAWYEAWIFAFGLGGARSAIAMVFAGLSLLSLMLSLAYPKGNRLIYVGTALLAFPFGLVLSYVIMALLFFVVIAPIGLLLRLLGHDPMQRRLGTGAASYWSAARPARDRKSYFRQF